MKKEVTFKSINRLAIPATISGIAEPLLSITDTAMVGNIPQNDVESLAAAGIVGAFLSMLIWVLGQTRSSISAILSQYLGAGKLDEVNRLPAQAIFFNILLSVLVIVTTLPFARPLFALFEADGLVLDYSVSYYSIRVWGMPLTLFTYALFGVFRGLQNTFYPMVIALIGTLVNIGLDYVFIYGIEGVLPAMYLEGAAYASLIAQAVMALLVFFFIRRHTPIPLRLKFPIHREMRRIVAMSANLFVRTIALNAALMLAVREATALGDRYIGAHTIAINLWLFAAFFIDGYGAAGNSMGGRFLGAKDYANLLELAKKILLYGFLVSLPLAGLGFLFYNSIGELFSSNAEVLETFASIFFLVLVGLPFNTMAFVYDGLYKGMGEMKFLRNVLLAATGLGFIPLLYFGLEMGWGIYSIWIAFLGWMFIRGSALGIHFWKRYRPLAQPH